ncbi:hypothetical protein Q7689_01020 [Nocardiopsis tropica]|uniref:hypothetical protein n=1 Tax=Nocardiopsis tropica TaxID=109330 RepID=UPI002E84322F|nr:hypothetical protein [Nocardiopsis tropica]
MHHGISGTTATHLETQAETFSQHAEEARTRAYELEQQAAELRGQAARQDALALDWRILTALATGTELPRLQRSDADQLADIFRVGARIVAAHPGLPQPTWSPSTDQLAGTFWGPDAVDALTAWAAAYNAPVEEDTVLPVPGRDSYRVVIDVEGVRVWLRADRPRDADAAPASSTTSPSTQRSAA